jgi:hypothetical protein
LTDPATAAAPSPEEVGAVAARLLAARREIAARDPRAVAAVLSRVAESWLAPGSHWMRRAIDGLAATGPFTRPMLELGLPRMIEPLAGAALETLVRRELGGWAALAAAPVPRLILHVLPSNLPGHAAIPSALTLLLRAAALLKSGRDDRVFAPLWAASIGEIDAALGACVESLYWPGGAGGAAADAAIAAADLVVAAGGDAAVAALRRRCAAAGVRFVGHGHRISLALVGREALHRASARALAADVALWDQLGCLSPQVCFVEGDRHQARRFAAAVRDELAVLAQALPPGSMSIGEILDVRRFRDAAAWRGFGDGEASLFAVGGREDGGSVAVVDEPALRPTPLHRCLRVVPIADVARVEAIVEPHRNLVEAAGIAVAEGRSAAVAAMLERAGVSHVTRLGDMQRPDLSWRQGGRPRIGEWCGDRVEGAPAPSSGQ